MVTDDNNVSFDKEIKDINSITIKTDENGNDPLMVAIIEENEKLVEKLLKENENWNLNVENSDGNTALHLAVIVENENILKILLQYPLKFNKRNKNNDNALTLAMNSKNANILDILLEKNPKFSFKKKKDGKVPIVMAIDDKKFGTTMQLIRHGATTLVKDTSGSFVLFRLLELENEFKEIIEIEISNKKDEKDKKDKKEEKDYEEQVINVKDIEDNTLIMRACKENRKNIVKYLLTKNPDLTHKNKEGDTALVLAVKEKNAEIVKMLLDYQDVDTAKIVSGNQKTLFQIAVDNQDKNSLDALFNHTKDVSLFTSTNPSKNLFLKALETGNLQVVEVISNYVDINLHINDKKETPLLFMVEKIKDEVIEAEAYYKSLYLKNKERYERHAATLAASAAAGASSTSKKSIPVVSDHEVIEIEKNNLKENDKTGNANSNEASSITDDSENTLKENASDDNNEDTNEISKVSTVYMEEPQEEKVEEKPEQKLEGKTATDKELSAKPVRRKATSRRTYSSYEKMAESEKKIQDILNSHGTINEKFNSIENAYNTNKRLLNNERYWKAKDKTYVVESTYTDIIKSLLLRKANVNSKNTKHENALHIACRYGLRNVVEIILKFGKNYDINALDKEGNTPLHYACYGKYTSIVKILLREEHINVNITDPNGDSPLMIAVYNNHTDTVLELLNYPNINIDMLNKVLETPLIAACRLNYYNVAKILIDHKANINNRYDANGETAIFHSVRNGSKILTKYLLNNKACITYTNKNGQTPLALAKVINNKEIIGILLSRRNTERPYTSRNSMRYSSSKPSTELKPYQSRGKSENISSNVKTNKSQYSSSKLSMTMNDKFKSLAMTNIRPEDSSKKPTSPSPLMMEPSTIYDKPEDVAKNMKINTVSSVMMQEPSSFFEEPKDSSNTNINGNANATSKKSTISSMGSMFAEPMEEFDEPEEKKEIKPSYSNIKFRPNTKFTNESSPSNGSVYNKYKKPFKSATSSPYLKNVLVAPKSNTTYIKKTVYNNTRFPATYTRVNSENSAFDRKSPVVSSSLEKTGTMDSEATKEIPILNDDIKGLRFSCYFGDLEGVENFLRSTLKEKNIFQLPKSLHEPGSTEPPNLEALKEYNKTRQCYITLDHIEMFAFSLICNGSKNDKLLEIMLKYGMNPNIQNNALYTLLILACKKDQESSALTLLDYNCDPNCQNKYKETALLLACKKGLMSVVKKLLELKVNVNLCNYKKESPLIMACWKKQIAIVKLLLKHNVDINHCNSLKESSLFIACYQDNIEIAKLLLEHGADINSKNINDETPLMAACNNNNEEMVELLMNYNADPNVKNVNGETAMTIAEKFKNEKMKKYLMKN
ncbi:ankyrin repeat-containing domain protein [Neocallimastix sp. 'constans']|jgi:ankyrin repeat protein